VKQVLDQLEQDGHFSTANIFMEPPSDGNMTEGDSADEDEPSSINNLSGHQLRSAAVVTINRQDDTESPETPGSEDDDEDANTDNADNADDDAVYSNEGDAAKAPVENRRAATASGAKTKNLTARRRKMQSRQWCKEDLDVQWPEFQLPPKNYIGATDPVNLFEYFVDDDICKFLVDMSNNYARVDKGNHGVDISVDQLKAFLWILLLSGYVNVPRWRMLWEVESETFNATVSNAMRRNMFEMVKRFLHCSDNRKLNAADKFAKMRPLMSMLNERFLACSSLEQHLCVDESMAPYFGRHGAKQFIRGKPVRFGFKMWCLCERLGYLIQFDPYQSGEYDKDVGLGASVVLNLVSKLPQSVPFKLFGDLFFTSLHLIDELKARGYGYTGTVMSNRTDRCPVMPPKLLAKKPRGFHDFQHDRAADTIVVGWNDNRPVYMASSVHGVNPVGICTRWSASEKKKISVELPDTVAKYNIYMGGVDRMDENMANYPSGSGQRNGGGLCLSSASKPAFTMHGKSIAKLTRARNTHLTFSNSDAQLLGPT